MQTHLLGVLPSDGDDGGRGNDERRRRLRSGKRGRESRGGEEEHGESGREPEGLRGDLSQL